MIVDWASVGSVISSVWRTDGVSEFVAALIGGGFALAAQQMAVLHDRKQAALAETERAKARAWAIFFKINEVHEIILATAKHISEAREAAELKKLDLWQTLQFPPHDHRELQWETEELVLLIDHRKFDIMTEYQQATVWLANLIQSVQLYREMRIAFLTGAPSTIEDGGESGTMALTKEQYDAAMPTVAHLQLLANSLEEVITAQRADMRKLLLDYVSAMKDMIGSAPQMEFADE